MKTAKSSSTALKTSPKTTKKAKPATKKPTVLKGLKNPQKSLERLLKQQTPPIASPTSEEEEVVPVGQVTVQEPQKWQKQYEEFYTYLTLRNKYEQVNGNGSKFFRDMLHKIEDKQELTPNMENALRKTIENDKKNMAVSSRTDDATEALRKFLGIEKKADAEVEVEGTKMTLKMKQWWCHTNRLESRIITGIVTRETEKAYYFIGHADMLDSKTCWRCGRELTNPASYFAGVGEVCASKLGVPYPSEVATMTSAEKKTFKNKIQQVLEKQTYEGWLPKSQVQEVLSE